MKRRTIEHYEFIRKIGAGGSGVVFLATDTLLQRPVVLKLLKRGNLTIEQMRATQLREARPPPSPTPPRRATPPIGEMPPPRPGKPRPPSATAPPTVGAISAVGEPPAE